MHLLKPCACLLFLPWPCLFDVRLWPEVPWPCLCDVRLWPEVPWPCLCDVRLWPEVTMSPLCCWLQFPFVDRETTKQWATRQCPWTLLAACPPNTPMPILPARLLRPPPAHTRLPGFGWLGGSTILPKLLFGSSVVKEVFEAFGHVVYLDLRPSSDGCTQVCRCHHPDATQRQPSPSRPKAPSANPLPAGPRHPAPTFCQQAQGTQRQPSASRAWVVLRRAMHDSRVATPL